MRVLLNQLSRRDLVQHSTYCRAGLGGSPTAPRPKLKLKDISDLKNQLKNKKPVLFKSLNQLYLMQKLTVQNSFKTDCR